AGPERRQWWLDRLARVHTHLLTRQARNPA
ncbi:MAG: hypothetical protein ABS909_00840, partial [Arthrobacter sp.]